MDEQVFVLLYGGMLKPDAFRMVQSCLIAVVQSSNDNVAMSTKTELKTHMGVVIKYVVGI